MQELDKFVESELAKILEETRQVVCQLAQKTAGKLGERVEQEKTIILSGAQQKAEELVARANRQAEQVVAEAQKKAAHESGQIIDQAKQRAEQTIKEAESKVKGEAKEKKKREVERIIEKAKQEAEQLLKSTQEGANLKAAEESARIIAKARQKAEQVASKAIEHVKKQCVEQLAQTISEAKEFSSEFARKTEAITDKLLKEIHGECGELYRAVEIGNEKSNNTIKRDEEFEKSNEAKTCPAQPAINESIIIRTNTEDKTDEVNEETGKNQLFVGEVKLIILPPCNFEQVGNLAKYLKQIPSLRLTDERFSSEAGELIGATIVINLIEPLPLLTLIEEINSVQSVVARQKNIEVVLSRRSWN